MVDSKKPVFGYWNIRGLGQTPRYLLNYAKVDFEDKHYKYGPAPDFSREDWNSVKFTLGLKYPNLPYFIDGEVGLTETFAIMKYIVNKYKPELKGKTVAEEANNDMLGLLLADFNQKVTGPCYSG